MMVYLGWCKINCSFALLKFAIWYWNIFLTKSGYVMHPLTHLAQELLTNVQCSGGSRSFAEEMRALKLRSAVLAIGSRQWPIENIRQIRSSYNCIRSCQRTQSQPFHSYLAFEPNWKGEKVQ